MQCNLPLLLTRLLLSCMLLLLLPSSCPCSTPFMCVRLYHMYWKRRGDVFRVLSALCK